MDLTCLVSLYGHDHTPSDIKVGEPKVASLLHLKHFQQLAKTGSNYW